MPSSIAIGIVFFVYLAVAALVKPMPGWRRYRLGVVAGALILAGVVLQHLPEAEWRSHVQNWLPGVYILAGYWLPAQLPARHAPALALWLREFDRRLLDAHGLHRAIERAPRVVLELLEAAYLCCYVIVPAGLVWLYVAGESAEADRFWTAVLLGALPCYGLLPWLETLPPRSIERTTAIYARHPTVRRANLRLLGAASVQANTFPSGHAAASVAAALAVASTTPLAGAVFLTIAAAIILGSVAGRYHYTLDSALGALAGVVGFLASRAS